MFSVPITKKKKNHLRLLSSGILNPTVAPPTGVNIYFRLLLSRLRQPIVAPACSYDNTVVTDRGGRFQS